VCGFLRLDKIFIDTDLFEKFEKSFALIPIRDFEGVELFLFLLQPFTISIAA